MFTKTVHLLSQLFLWTLPSALAGKKKQKPKSSLLLRPKHKWCCCVLAWLPPLMALISHFLNAAKLSSEDDGFACVIWLSVKDIITQMGELSSCFVKLLMDVGAFGYLAKSCSSFRSETAVGRCVRNKNFFFFLHCRDEILPPISVYLLANEAGAERDNAHCQIWEALQCFPHHETIERDRDGWTALDAHHYITGQSGNLQFTEKGIDLYG